MKNVLIIYNTNAGRKKALKYKKKIIKFFLDRNCTFKFVDLDEYEETNISDYDTVIAAGGDGTVNRAAQKLINTSKVLGIIPCGTANLLAANLGIRQNLQDALNVINDQNITNTDTLKINGFYSVLRAGFGYDCNIISKTQQILKNKFGYFAYFISGILFALKLKKKEYNFTCSGKEHKEIASCLIIANAANMYENTCFVGEKSPVTDGFFDIFILNTSNPFIFLIEFFKIVLNIKTSNKNVKYLKAVNMQIKNEFINCHIDGEHKKIKGDIVINIAPESLKIFSK